MTELGAQFDSKLRIYLVIQVAAVLVATVAGLVVLPLWVFVGPLWARAYFPTIKARLTDRALLYEHGVWFRSEMSIPLDKIQDVSLHHGPILDYLGLASLRIETAGGQPGSAAALLGVKDAAQFRSEILARRDRVTVRDDAGDESVEIQLLREIRDSLARIEAGLR